MKSVRINSLDNAENQNPSRLDQTASHWTPTTQLADPPRSLLF
jgi:hypothetical protein